MYFCCFFFVFLTGGYFVVFRYVGSCSWVCMRGDMGIRVIVGVCTGMRVR